MKKRIYRMIAIVLSLIIVLSGFESPVLAEDNFFDYCNSQTNYKEYIGDGYNLMHDHISSVFATPFASVGF